MSAAPARPDDTAWLMVFGCWVIACLSALGALFFSEVMELVPCLLCWYQRIFMFPLVLLLPLGLFPYDRKVVRYTLPLAAIGWLIAVFQVLLVWGVVPERAAPCRQGISCSEVQWEILGFVNIPFLSFLAFSTMVALLVAAHLRSPR